MPGMFCANSKALSVANCKTCCFMFSIESLLGAVIFAGIAIGSFLWGFLSDRIGRRPVVCVSALLTGIVGAASSLAPNMASLIFSRFVVGLVLGGAPMAFALASEFIVAKHRGSTMILFNMFWTVGSILEATLAWFTLGGANALSWRYLLAISSAPGGYA